MKRLILILLIAIVGHLGNAQDMTLSELKLVLAQKATIVNDQGHMVQYEYAGLEVYLIADETHNRMRLMSGIIEEEKITNETMRVLMNANFDKALDAKYALSNQVLWAVYAHPLKELQKQQIIDALTQVVNLVNTYGSTYTSTGLVFGGE